MDAGRLHKLARTLREVAVAATADPSDEPVSPSLLAVAEDVAAHRDSGVGDIARRTALAQSVVSAAVATLRDRGVVGVEADPRDGRRSVVNVTAESRLRVMRARGRRPVGTALASVHPSLTTEQRREVVQLLDRLSALLVDAGSSSAQDGTRARPSRAGRGRSAGTSRR